MNFLGYVKDSELSKARQENAKLRAKLDDHAMLQAAVQVYKEDFNQVLLKKLFVAMLQAAVQVYKEDSNQVFLKTLFVAMLQAAVQVYKDFNQVFL